MENFQTLVWLMGTAMALVGIAQFFKFPYPPVLIFGGAAIGFIPQVSALSIDPNLILIVVLPPILYHAAYSLAFGEFKRHIIEISSLALGLVAATTLVVAVLFKWLFPQFPWALAFAFGAIISPPDAVAAIAILKRFRIKTKLITLLEGESLINDASGLVLYRLAVIALLSSSFSLNQASVEFIKVVFGGTIIGFVLGYGLHWFSSHFFGSVMAAVFSFAIPYILYLVADYLAVSGVLAVVIGGLIGSRLFKTHFSSLTRVISLAGWDIFIIILNCFVFMLIGSQFGAAARQMPLDRLIIYSGYGLLITCITILVRMVWIYTNEAIQYALKKEMARLAAKKHILKDTTLLSWAGMRGIVSLTAVLALPFYLPNGALVPGREEVVFITFIVIFLTLLIPSLSLHALIQWLKITPEESEEVVRRVRQHLARVAEKELHHQYAQKRIGENEYFFLLTYFNTRYRIFEISSHMESNFHSIEWVRRDILRIQRIHLIEMWERHEIEDGLLNLLERELDIEETQVARAELK
ncbi:Na+/H+ antiporter [Candidatus Protochlamydia phocaeensis]|uniref:Na+/H+ antiporter n=1 Tax=Candidatus Protochlamydia phocaeensis TaxID=1414722 RepID=UPI000838295B|nr:Na+/H+ antiporter [Candidatus Protochlamydia phocaeensis]